MCSTLYSIINLMKVFSTESDDCKENITPRLCMIHLKLLTRILLTNWVGGKMVVYELTNLH